MPSENAKVSFKPYKRGFKKFLGDLEADIMEIIWTKERVTVRDVYQEMLKGRDIAYTTVMSTMSNLAKKGVLYQEKQDAAYIYMPKVSKGEFAKNMVREVLDGLLDGFSEPLLANIASLPDTPEAKKVLSEIKQMLDEDDKGQDNE
ncbi:MAG: BlaI/MecI/CopY family transcriptional regulator [Candidatus Aquicultor sp.]